MSDLITVITHDAMDISHTDIDLFIQKASLQFLLCLPLLQILPIQNKKGLILNVEIYEQSA